MKVTCTKPEAAIRQIDIAIGLLFTDGDPLAIRTLAGAAHGILADLAEHKELGSSWRTQVIEDSGLSQRAALRIINGAQNYLKHANNDPSSTLSFDEKENDHLLFLASIECASLEQQLSYSMQAYQVRYLAAYPEKIGHDTMPVQKAKMAFPEIQEKQRTEQLVQGHIFLEHILKTKGLL